MPNLNINGRNMSVEASNDTPLLWVIREQLQMTGTKFGCGAGLCGACMCQVTQGDVTLGENHVLDRTDLDAGWTLACQARPASDELHLKFPD